MRFAFILAEKGIWPTVVMCEVLRVSRSGYYAWKDRPASARTVADRELVVEIKAAHKAGRGIYGSPRVHRMLRNSGRRIGKERVARLMQQEGIVAKRRKKFCITTDSKHPDVLQAYPRLAAFRRLGLDWDVSPLNLRIFGAQGCC